LSGSAAWDNGLNGIKGKKKGILKKKKWKNFCKGVLNGSL
jgi:hypothetical protein